MSVIKKDGTFELGKEIEKGIFLPCHEHGTKKKNITDPSSKQDACTS